MIRAFLLCWFAILSFTVAKTYEPEPDGYSHRDLAEMNKLIDRTLAKPKHHMSEGEKAAALIELGWGQR